MKMQDKKQYLSNALRHRITASGVPLKTIANRTKIEYNRLCRIKYGAKPTLEEAEVIQKILAAPLGNAPNLEATDANKN